MKLSEWQKDQWERGVKSGPFVIEQDLISPHVLQHGVNTVSTRRQHRVNTVRLTSSYERQQIVLLENLAKKVGCSPSKFQFALTTVKLAELLKD